MTSTAVESESSQEGKLHGAGGPSGSWRRSFIVWLRRDQSRQWVRRKAVGGWMNILIAVTAGVTVVTAGFLAQQRWPEPNTWAAGALKLFVLWCMSFLPGWLYVRFLGMRAKALWTDYVLTLHRLCWELPRYLPEPPESSEYHERWTADGGVAASNNIYRQKFEAYYGRQVPARSDLPAASGTRVEDDYIVRTESLFPMFLATAVLATGWAAVLWDTGFLTAPSNIWDTLKFGFLGSYAFVVSMLIRRYFQSDLRPSAYATSVFRIMLVLLIVAVIHQVLHASARSTTGGELALAFLVGFFPLAGLQVVQRLVSRLFRVVVPPLTSDYPLDQLDGLSLWYEARLTEEGVEDMQNLTTMDLVDVILHTRVPPGRLVDWIDQAFLLIHLEQAARSDLKQLRQPKPGPNCVHHIHGSLDGIEAMTGAQARVALRRVGIRTATDLLKAFSIEQPPAQGRVVGRCFHATAVGEPLPPVQLRLLVHILAAEPGLAAVWNWQRNGVVLRAENISGR